jgi:hypothetical protein
MIPMSKSEIKEREKEKAHFLSMGRKKLST